jgi:membrane protease YdiL (CAAX protease family)
LRADAASDFSLFFFPEVHQYHMSFIRFLINVVALSVVMTWVFIHTEGSLFVAILMHLLFNLTASWKQHGPLMVIYAAAAVTVIALGGLNSGRGWAIVRAET